MLEKLLLATKVCDVIRHCRYVNDPSMLASFLYMIANGKMQLVICTLRYEIHQAVDSYYVPSAALLAIGPH